MSIRIEDSKESNKSAKLIVHVTAFKHTDLKRG